MLRQLAVRVFPLVLLALTLTACQQKGSSLRLVSTEGAVYTQHFDQAYAGRTADGDLHFILIDEGIKPNKVRKRDNAIQPVAQIPLRQVVYLRVVWRADAVARNDPGRTTNATAHWYVTGVGSLGNQDMLHYSGAGALRDSGPGDSVRATLRAFSMRLVDQQGELSDPIGSATMSGSIDARWDDAVIRNMLAQFEKN